jgi:hypothetical protein
MKPFAITVEHLDGPPCQRCPEGTSPHALRWLVQWHGPRGARIGFQLACDRTLIATLDNPALKDFK